MKKVCKVILSIVGILIFLLLLFFIIDHIIAKKYEVNVEVQSENDNINATIRAVVVRVYDNSLMVLGTESTKDLYSVSFTDEGNIGFKQGQEVLIYFNGVVMDSYPAQLGEVSEIEIIKEKSNISIPDDILREYYSSYDNVDVVISGLTRDGIALTITDTNELPYNYSHNYIIYQKNCSSGGGEVWNEMNKISNISSTDTEEMLTDNLPNIETSNNSTIEERKYDWTSLYGKLEERRV